MIRTNVYVLLFENFTGLDVFGPVEVLGRIEGAEITFVSLNGGMIVNDQNIRILTEPVSVIEKDGILVVPGGYGTRRLVNDPSFLQALKGASEISGYVLSVCTGSALLAKAGLLNGRKATSNKIAFAWVKSCSEKTDWIKNARWLSDGKYYTSAGVSAGIDMALGFVSDVYGCDRAAEIARRMEYRFEQVRKTTSAGKISNMQNI